MKKITRTIETHTIMPGEVTVVNGEVITNELSPIVVTNQSLNQEKAIKLTQKQYGKNKQFVILAIESISETYGVDFDKFMEIAEIIEK